MWSPEADPARRRLIAGLVALPVAALAGCGFTPVHAPGGPGERLRGRLAVAAPQTPMGYRLAARLEERVGRPEVPALRLDVTLDVRREAAAIARDGDSTRYTLLGTATWRLTEAGGAPVTQGSVEGFTAYSATGSTVATETARNDAESRLAILLADRIVVRLIAALA